MMGKPELVNLNCKYSYANSGQIICGGKLKTLIVYGTRYGATAGTSEEIAKILGNEGFDVKVVNAKEEKVKDISAFELIVVGTGVQMGRWAGEVEEFLKKHEKELQAKKVAIFVSSMKTIAEREGKTADVESARE